MPVTDPDLAEASAYWVVRGRLMAGEYPGSPSAAGMRAKLASLLNAGIRTFLDLTEADEVTRLGPLRPYEEDLRALTAESAVEVSHTRFPIRDFDVPTRGLMISILDALDAALGRGMPAYVHCLAGRGRTGTVVGCYLVRHAERLLGTSASDRAGPLALARITELRVAQDVPFPKDSPQTPAQRDLVLGWQPGL
ncbi:MAG: hypothetical protein P1P84_25250 [Deferrisomatales bacterium]|nr:hypothetical protein [Deferrisomatales bacterium]